MSAGIISYDGEITSPKILGGWGRSRTPCMMRHFVTYCNLYADPMVDVGMTIMVRTQYQLDEVMVWQGSK